MSKDNNIKKSSLKSRKRLDNSVQFNDGLKTDGKVDTQFLEVEEYELTKEEREEKKAVNKEMKRQEGQNRDEIVDLDRQLTDYIAQIQPIDITPDSWDQQILQVTGIPKNELLHNEDGTIFFRGNQVNDLTDKHWQDIKSLDTSDNSEIFNQTFKDFLNTPGVGQLLRKQPVQKSFQEIAWNLQSYVDMLGDSGKKVATILGVKQNDKGDLNLTADQVANISGKQWNDIKKLADEVPEHVNPKSRNVSYKEQVEQYFERNLESQEIVQRKLTEFQNISSSQQVQTNTNDINNPVMNMSKNENMTDDEKLVNERLADSLSQYINGLDFPPEKEDLAQILNVSPESLQYNDNGNVKISAAQVENLSGEQWNNIKNLTSLYDDISFEESFDKEDSVMDKFAEFNKNQPIYENINYFDPNTNLPNLSALKPDEPASEDFMIDSSTSNLSQTQQLGNSSLPSKSLSEQDLDPITEAIRREILSKQRALIVDYLKQNDPSINDEIKDAKKYSEYGKDEENQKKIQEALKNVQLKSALEGAEVAGYKNVHETFKDSFSPIKWADGTGIGATPDITTRSQVVKNAAGGEIATLTESTHKITPPVKVKDSKGQEVELKNYRTIDFPTELETKTGPMHLSMAVKDQNGKNIALSKAVYFTAHYDDSGKLTEVSSPKPVMFSSTDPDAVGYIEHQGQIYTLPVTQSKYQEMMRALGREEEIGLSQSIDAPELSKDIAMVKTGHTKESPKVSKQEELKKEQSSYIQQQVDLELQKQKQYSPDEFEKSHDKEKFLKDLLESDLSTADKSKYLSKISKAGHTEQVMGALVSSKLDKNVKNDIVGDLFRDATDDERKKMVSALSKNDDGRKLIINAFEKGSSKERYDISNAIAESGGVKDKTDLTKQIISAIERTGQETTVSNFNKMGQDGENLIEEVAKTTSDVSIKNAAETVEKPEESKKDSSIKIAEETVEIKPEEYKKEVKKEERHKSVVEVKSHSEKADSLRETLSKSYHPVIPAKKSDKEISEMVKPLSEELDGKNLEEQKKFIDTKLDELSKGENALSNGDKARLLMKLREREASKRSERIDKIQKGELPPTKDDIVVKVQSTTRETDKEGFPTPEVGKFKNKPELVGKVSGIGLQVYLNNKIDKLVSPPPVKPKEKEGYTLGGSGPKYR